jgi:RNA polymerase-binding transcription factor DksA
MRYFTIEQRETLERQLKARAAELRREIDAALERADTTEAGHLANRFEELDDEAVADLEESIDLASLERDMRELRQVVDATRRLHSPELGICSDCGGDIPYARLAAQPTATRCRACEALAERTAAPGVHAAL